MQSNYLIYILIILLASIIFALVWYILFTIFRVPNDKEKYLDGLPFLYKLSKPLINVLSFYIEPFINEKSYIKYKNLITYAGVDFQFVPKHIIAGKLISSIICGCIFLVLTIILEQNLILSLLGFLFGYFYPDLWLKDKKLKRNNDFSKNIPFFLDMVTLSVESGLNLNGALKQAVNKAPASPVRYEFEKVLRDIKTGISRSEAFRRMSARVDDQSIKSLVSSIIQAEKMGMNLGPILRSQAEQRRVERFLKAEKMAMEAPVKLLFPLVAFIFPCTFIVIGFPVYVMIVDAFK